MTAEFRDVSEYDYHNDRIDVDTPSLSSSCAKLIVTESPLHAWTFHPRLGGAEREVTESQERGSMIHSLLLGAGSEVVQVDAKDWRTNAARAARAAAREEGKIAVLSSKFKFISGAVDIIKRRIETAGIRLDGRSEVTGVWISDGALCRCRFDHLPAGGSQVLDLKTCESAHPEAIRRTIENFGYDIQAAAYSEAYAEITLAGMAPRFRWVFAECEPPYAVTVVPFTGSMAELGRRRWARAVRTWKRCLATNEWPGYVTGEAQIEASDWAMARELEANYDENV